MKIITPISIGELYDKITILEIKTTNIKNSEKLVNIIKEFKELKKVAEEYPIDKLYYNQLLEINKRIWDIEDGIRECERDKHFEERFKDLARAVYFNNDERSRIKRKINIKYGSEFIEEKSYQKY